VGFTRRVIFISLLLSIVITTTLVIIFARTGSGRFEAEASEYGEAAPAPRAEAEGIAPPEDVPETTGADVGAESEKRIRTIARNLMTPAGKINTRAVAALQALGPGVIPIVLHRFTGEETPEQEALLAVLEAFSEPEVAHHLTSVLPSTHSKTMGRRIGNTIHTLGDAQCCEQLVEITADRNEAARLGACIALRTCPTEMSSAALLQQVAHDPSPECRVEALESLTPAPDAVADEGVRVALQDETADIRLAAVRLIVRRKAAYFQEELKRLTRADVSPHVRKACAQALVELRMKSPPPEGGGQ
jgi:hypothetical protein